MSHEEHLVALKDGSIPLPAKCSNQLKRLIYAHSAATPPVINSSLQGPGQSGGSGLRPQGGPEKEPPTSLPINNQTTAPGVISQCQNQPTTSEGVDGSSYQSDQSKRPIFPHLPYSPYCSPNSSPRVRRKPLRETTRVNSINDQSGEYIQLNQYKLEKGAIGQVVSF